MSETKYYWPMAYRYTPDGPEICFTTEPAHTFEQAEKQFDIWQNHYGYQLVSRWIEIKTETSTELSAKRINMDLVRQLWKDLGDIPVKDGGYGAFILKGWGYHTIYSMREDIWKWFEFAFDISVHDDLMFPTKED